MKLFVKILILDRTDSSQGRREEPSTTESFVEVSNLSLGESKNQVPSHL